MPFKSARQRRFLFARKPQVAKKFAAHGKRKSVRSKGGVLTFVLFILAIPTILVILVLIAAND